MEENIQNPNGDLWRAGQPAPSKGAPEIIHFAPEDTVHTVDLEKYGDCYDPDYKDGQSSDNDGDE